MMKKRRISLLSIIASLLIVFGFLFCGCETKGEIKASVLELTVEQMELSVGDTSSVSVKEPQEGTTYSFRSTSTAITVDENGGIVANEIGSAVVIVSSSSNETGTCLVVVKDTKPVELSELKIENQPSELTVGETLNLTYLKEPIDADNYNSIQWSSDNEYVASVNQNGVLTANKPGTATIIVKATGTDKKAEISLSILARPSVLTLNYDDATGVLGNNDLVIEASLFTDYDNVAVEGYTSSNPSVATINEQGEVSFVSVGKTIISYAVTCGTERLEKTCKIAVIEKEGYTVIRTPKQLQDIGNISGNYMLGNDIDLFEACSEGGELYHAGQGFTPLFNEKASAFSGVFDGMGYSIKNLKIKRTNSAFVALFSYINVNQGTEGVICNLALEGGKIEGGNYCAAFVGSYNGSGSAAAGLKNCWTDIEIVSCGQSCGGLIAYNGALIENCYSLSKISGTGTLSSVSHNTLANNAVIGVKHTYICKDNQETVTQLVNVDKLNDTIMEAEYKTLEELKVAELYSSWDTDVWEIVDGCLPKLKTANDR